MAREVRVSPEGDTVAIRTDAPEEAWNAWGFINAVNGGGWCDSNHVKDWVAFTEEVS